MRHCRLCITVSGILFNLAKGYLQIPIDEAGIKKMALGVGLSGLWVYSYDVLACPILDWCVWLCECQRWVYMVICVHVCMYVNVESHLSNGTKEIDGVNGILWIFFFFFLASLDWGLNWDKTVWERNVYIICANMQKVWTVTFIFFSLNVYDYFYYNAWYMYVYQVYLQIFRDSFIGIAVINHFGEEIFSTEVALSERNYMLGAFVYFQLNSGFIWTWNVH